LVAVAGIVKGDFCRSWPASPTGLVRAIRVLLRFPS
jgi:hypothetical protein